MFIKTCFVALSAALLLSACSTTGQSGAGGMSMPADKVMNCPCCKSMEHGKSCCPAGESCPCCKGMDRKTGMICNPVK